MGLNKWVLGAGVALVAVAMPGQAVAEPEVDLAAGYGHDSRGDAVTATTPMPVASVGKSFSALAGLSNAHIADRLDVVEGTVKRHLDLDNRVQAAIVAHEAGLTGGG